MDIAQRPAEVENRQRVGAREADLVSSRHHREFLVTLAGACEPFDAHWPRRAQARADAVNGEILRPLSPRAARAWTLTFDNGREFAGHQDLARQSSYRTYFAQPYHSRERGTNENTNGPIRQYFPQTMDWRRVRREDLEHTMNRPRKTLGYVLPAALFCTDA